MSIAVAIFAVGFVVADRIGFVAGLAFIARVLARDAPPSVRLLALGLAPLSAVAERSVVTGLVGLWRARAVPVSVAIGVAIDVSVGIGVNVNVGVTITIITSAAIAGRGSE